MAKVYIENIMSDYVFSWFYETVKYDGGDGAAAICCSNIEEAYNQFVFWAKTIHVTKHLPPHVDRYKVDTEKGERTGNVINVHDSNENFIFCDHECDLGFGDVSFVIKEEYECDKSFILRKV